MATIKMKNETTGQFKEVPVGFSWTTFFFGWFPALLRGDWKNFLILFFLTIPTLGIILIVYWFKYNKIYINDLISKGFKAVLNREEAEFMSAKIGTPLPIINNTFISLVHEYKDRTEEQFHHIHNDQFTTLNERIKKAEYKKDHPLTIKLCSEVIEIAEDQPSLNIAEYIFLKKIGVAHEKNGDIQSASNSYKCAKNNINNLISSGKNAADYAAEIGILDRKIYKLQELRIRNDMDAS